MRTPTRWVMPPPPDDATVALAQVLTLPVALAQVLMRRGVHTFDDARRYFRPNWDQLADPLQMLGMDRAVTRIATAIQQREPILVYGDYDVDGTTSVALVCHYLRHIGHPFEYYLPDRATEGYGLSIPGVDYAQQQGCTLLIVLDCGTKDHAATAHAAAQGLDVIIVDHHQPDAQLPVCVALLNPHQPGCSYPFKDLSACGIAFRLLQALDAHLGLGTDLQQWCELPALSTACDLVPLVGENRVIAALGQEKLRTAALPGIAALMQRSERPRAWDSTDLLFYLGPRINAAGRLHHAREAVALLLGEADALAHLETHAASLDQHNTLRRAVEADMVATATAQLSADPVLATRHSIVLADASWHKGVVGIVASKLVERYYRPTVLLTHSEDGLLVGSCRSVQGFDIHAALTACAPHLTRFGGHRYAAGVSVAAERLAAFREAFEAYCAAHLRPDQRAPELPIDAELSFAEVDAKLVRVLRQMAPFGPGNPHPYFLTQDVEIVQWKVLKEDHLKLTLRQGKHSFPAVGFNLAHQAPALAPGGRVRVVFDPQFNVWKGQTSIQLVLKDLRPQD